MNKFFVCNSIPYVNGKPHIGHALEFVQSDVIRRIHEIQGDETALLCGGDENALKNVWAAEQAKEPIQKFIDKNTELFAKLAQALDVHFDFWQKASDKKHHISSQKLWQLCFENGDIYKKTYTGLYCVGCEQFYEKEELDKNGECFEHPGKKLEVVSEENYFFRLSKYEKQLLYLLESSIIKIIPSVRRNEAVSFIKQGLEDISISRSNARAKNWGVEVPNDPTQKMYVWFDALNIYQSGVGFGWDEKLYKKWWPADIHVIGKGILRFHAIYWPAFLLSAKLPLPKSIFVHGYFTVNGQKMSKTLGNVVDPMEMIKKYGVDALRYYLLSEIPSTSDGDFSEKKLLEVYNADLANGLGNLISRVAKLCETQQFSAQSLEQKTFGHLLDVEVYSEALSLYKFHDAVAFIWQKIGRLDKYINDEKPWELIKTQSFDKAQDKNSRLGAEQAKLNTVLSLAVEEIREIAVLLKPFLPQTAKKIEEQFKDPKIISKPSLFPRIS